MLQQYSKKVFFQCEKYKALIIKRLTFFTLKKEVFFLKKANKDIFIYFCFHIE